MTVDATAAPHQHSRAGCSGRCVHSLLASDIPAERPLHRTCAAPSTGERGSMGETPSIWTRARRVCWPRCDCAASVPAWCRRRAGGRAAPLTPPMLNGAADSEE